VTSGDYVTSGEGFDYLTCIRCQLRVDVDSKEALYGEATDGGAAWICEPCLTGAESQAILDDYMALGESMQAAGLGGDADVEAMSEDEYEMREGLAQQLYEHAPGSFYAGGQPKE
jgi:hypothetical protein